MPTQTIIAGLPQSARDNIKTMHDDGCTVMKIHTWLQSQGFDRVTYGMTRGWCAKKFGVRKKACFIEPAETFEERLQQYIGALLEYEHATFTINNLGLRGPPWNYCSITLLRIGAIEKMREYSPMRYRIVMMKDELARI